MNKKEIIKDYISGLEMENTRLVYELAKKNEKIETLMKWIYLLGGSGILLSIIDKKTIDYYFENREKFTGKFQDIIHEIQTKLELDLLEKN